MDSFLNHIQAMKNELDAFKPQNYINNVLEAFRNHDRVIFCTMGKSAFACAKVVYTARSYGLEWYDLDVCHAFHGDAGIIKDNDLLVLVSKSGQTKETIAVAQYFTSHEKIAVTSDSRSALSYLCNQTLYIPNKDEGSPFGYAPMISTSLYMIVLHAVLCDVIESKGVTLENYAKNHPGGSIGEKLQLDKTLGPVKTF